MSASLLREHAQKLMREFAEYLPDGGCFTFSGPLVDGGKSYELTFRESPAPDDMSPGNGT